MHSIYASFPLITSILLLAAAVRPHPQGLLPSSGEPPAAFPLENTGITVRDDDEDGGFVTPRSLKAFPFNRSLTGVEQFFGSTSGSTDNGNDVEMRINHSGNHPSDEISNSGGEENITSPSSACDQRSNSLKSRRLRNRDPGQEHPSCLANPIDRNSPSEPQIEQDKVQLGAGNRELNQGKNIPVDVPDFDFPTKEKDYMGTSTTTRANSEICPPEREYPLCADDKAISAVPEGVARFFAQVTYMLFPAYAYNPFFRCAFPEILWCCSGFANVIVISPNSVENNPPLLGLACRPQDPTHVIDPATVKPVNED